MKLMATIGSVSVLLSVLGVRAETLWQCDARHPDGVRLRGGWKVTAEGWRMSTNGYALEFTNLPPARANKRLSFDIRWHARNPKSRGTPHFGVYGVAGSGASFLVRSLDGRCMDVAMNAPDGTSMRRGYWNPFEPKFTFARAETNPPVTHVELEMRADSHALRLNGEAVWYEKIPFPGLTTLSFQQYATDCSVDNFKLDTLDVDAGAFPPSEPQTVPDDGRTTYALSPDAFSSRGGGFMFWMRLEPGPNRVSFKNAAGEELVGAANADVFMIVNVAKKQGGTWDFRRRLGGQSPGDWIHVAFTWRPDGTCRYFLNALPYTPGFSAGERFGCNISGNGLDRPAALEVMNSRHPQARRARIQELKVFRRPISNAEVSDAYRARMPIDAVLKDGLVESGKPVSLSFSVAPAGYYTRPKPVAGPNRPASVPLQLVLSALAPLHDDVRRPERVTDYRACSAVTQDFGRVQVDAPRDLLLPPRILTNGVYALSLVVGDGAFVKTRKITAGDFPKALAVSASDEEWQMVGAPLVQKTFARAADCDFTSGAVRAGNLNGTRYLEGDGKLQTVLAVPQNAIGHPLLLEICWPDDKLRYAGFYLYPERQGLTRDRLQAGLLSGGEFKLTHQVQRQQYLVFCQTTNMLFEARAMAKGMPVGIAAVRLFRLAEPLPRLKVRPPEGLRGRAFGFADEDQTFYNNFDSGKTGTLGVADELMRYFAYTGQNAMDQMFFRYMMTLCPIENTLEGMNMFPEHASELGALPKIFAANGCELWAQVSVQNLPEINYFNLIDSRRREQGCLFLDKNGQDRFLYNQGAFRPNIANPLVRRAFVDYCADYVNEVATSGVTTVEYNGIGPWPIDYGYDDWTFGRFLSETGTPRPVHLVERATVIPEYHARYDWLTATNGPVRAKWLRWRADRVTAWYENLAQAMTQTNPQLEIVLVLPSGEDVYAKEGIDLAALAKISNVRLGTPFRAFNNYRWLHFRGNPQAKDLKTEYARRFDFAAEDELGQARTRFGAAARTIVCGQYHETYGTTLCPQRFGSAFQDADVKPWGRNWLRELTYAVAKGDTLALFTGQQPLGTLGHEREAREFARAYRALPALPFADAVGDNPSVVVRALETKNGIYLYCVNLTDAPQTVRPELFRKKGWFRRPRYVDLSTGEMRHDPSIALLPYQLRSFLLATTQSGN